MCKEFLTLHELFLTNPSLVKGAKTRSLRLWSKLTRVLDVSESFRFSIDKRRVIITSKVSEDWSYLYHGLKIEINSTDKIKLILLGIDVDLVTTFTPSEIPLFVWRCLHMCGCERKQNGIKCDS